MITRHLVAVAAALLCSLAALFPVSVQAALSVEVSGTCTNGGFRTGGSDNTTTVALSTGITTCASNDIIIAVVYAECTTGGGAAGAQCVGGPARSITGVSGGSLTWNHCGTAYSGGSPCGTAADYAPGEELTHSSYGNLSVWWAYASGVVSAATITATASAEFDNAALLVFAINGAANFTNPFDTNTSLPVVANSLSASATNPTTSGMSTTTAATVLLGCVGSSTAYVGTPAASYTLIGTATETAGEWFASVNCESQVVAATQSSVTQAWGNVAAGWLMWASAVTATAGGASAAPSALPLMGVGG
jgi:hypothetical protein